MGNIEYMLDVNSTWISEMVYRGLKVKVIIHRSHRDLTPVLSFKHIPCMGFYGGALNEIEAVLNGVGFLFRYVIDEISKKCER